MNATVHYVVNPDVSCREEGADGALLFNPDTNDVLVINITGLLIWQALNTPRTEAQVVAELQQRCHDVPEEAVTQDTHEFVEHLLNRGFVGIAAGGVGA